MCARQPPHTHTRRRRTCFTGVGRPRRTSMSSAGAEQQQLLAEAARAPRGNSSKKGSPKKASREVGDDDESGTPSNNEKPLPVGKAILYLMGAAAVAAVCVMFVSRRRGLGNAAQMSDAGRWVYRRVHDLSAGRGPTLLDPQMAARLSHARQRALK